MSEKIRLTSISPLYDFKDESEIETFIAIFQGEQLPEELESNYNGALWDCSYEDKEMFYEEILDSAFCLELKHTFVYKEVIILSHIPEKDFLEMLNN